MTIRLPGLARHLPVRLGHQTFECRRVRRRRASAEIQADRARCVLVDDQPELGAVTRVPGGHPRFLLGVDAPLRALVA